MPALANVSLTNTFDEWRTRTNQLVIKTNEMELSTANAYVTANAAMLTGNSAFDRANTVSSNSAAAFGKANTANIIAVLAYDRSNSVNALANSANITALFANTAASSAYDKANSANIITFASFAKANAALANTSGITFEGDLSISGNVKVDSTSLFVDKHSNRIGIGTLLPNTTVEISDAVNLGLRFSNTSHQSYYREIGRDNNSTGNFYIRRAEGASSINDFTIDTSGKVGIGTNTPDLTLTVQGTGNISSYLYVAGMNVQPTIQAAFNTANTATSAAAAYDKANTANIIAVSAFAGANLSAKLTGATFTGAITANSTSGYGIIGGSTYNHAIFGKSSNTTFGGVVGYTTNDTIYGILGYTNTYSFYGSGIMHNIGEIRSTSDITAYYSDRRLKRDIIPIDLPIQKLKTISGVYYKQNELAKSYGYNSDESQVGVIAQEVQKVVPEAVTLAPFDTVYDNGIPYSKSGENYLTVKYEKLIPLLIEAIKDQQKEIDIIKKLLENK